MIAFERRGCEPRTRRTSSAPGSAAEIAVKHWPQVHQSVAIHDPPKILLVEDDDEMRSRLAQSLRQEGYTVVECDGARQLWDRIDMFGRSAFLEDFDLIISASNMPGFSSLTLLSWLHEDCFGPPVILIMLPDDESAHDAANRLGAARTLDKPFEIDDLIDKVHEVLF